MRQSSQLRIAELARRCCCRRRGSHPALPRANTCAMLVGPMPSRYALLRKNLYCLCFLLLDLESACSEVPNVRRVACFCNGVQIIRVQYLSYEVSFVVN